MYFLIALILGIVIAFLVTGSMLAKMNTAVKQRAAANYVRNGSFSLSAQNDRFLYENTTKTRRSSSNNNSSNNRGRRKRR